MRTLINVVVHLKQAAMEALMDITLLKGRQANDKDLSELDFHRVSMHSLGRSEFRALSERAQQVYIYRLAA